jgi:hypothetical protein
MRPLNIKLYDIARAKLNFTDDDAMEFVSSIHELNDHRFENLVTKEFLSEKINEINTRFNSLELSFEKKFNKIDQKFITFESATNQRFIQNESNIDRRFSTFQSNIDLKFSESQSNVDQRFKDAESFNSQQFTEIKASIDTKIAEAESELTKWMFIFWASQMTITLGILLLILNK